MEFSEHFTEYAIEFFFRYLTFAFRTNSCKYQKTILLTLLFIKINNYINFITQDSQENRKASGCS